MFAPLPLSPRRHSSRPIFLHLGRPKPSIAVPTGRYLSVVAHGRGPHLCGRLSAAPSPPGRGDPGPRALPRAPSPARRPEQEDRQHPAVTQPCVARGALPLPSAGQRWHRVASGPRYGRGSGCPPPAPPAAPAPAAPLGAQPPLSPCRPTPAPPPRRPPELLSGVRVPEPPAAPGCGLRAKPGGGSDPAVPGAAAGGGDGKRKRGAARSRSRTLEELRACGGRPRRRELGGPRAAACGPGATLSRGRRPELGGINRMPPGLQLGNEARGSSQLWLCVSRHPRRPPGPADCASHPGLGETKKEGSKDGLGEGGGGETKADKGRRRPQTGRGGAPRHGKQSGAGPRGRGPGVGVGVGVEWGLGWGDRGKSRG